MPVRIQLSRRKGWRKPAGAVVVSRPSKFGNPFVAGREAPGALMPGRVVQDRRHAARLFDGHAPQNATLVAAARRELRGKDLACWCRLCDLHAETGLPAGERCPWCEPCHADTLLVIANSEGAPC